MIVAYKIIHDFNGICVTVKADKQIFIPHVIVIGFVQQAVIYGSVKRTIDVCLAYFVIKRGTANLWFDALWARLRIKSGGVELNNKIHVSSISHLSIK
jgi:hypothetical protein